MPPSRKIAGKTTFQDDWLQVPEFKFIRRKEGDPYSAHCSLCMKTFGLSNMGRQAVVSHVEGKKHTGKFKNCTGSYGMQLFTTQKEKESSALPASAGPTAAETDPGVATADRATLNSAATSGELTAASGELTASLRPAGGTTEAPHGLSHWIQREEVTRAEIIWCLASVLHHVSQSAAGQCISLLPFMLPDSQIASKLQLGRTKIGYVINHGLGPFFHDVVVRKAMESDFVTAFFDESLNKSSQNTQMDFAIGFWDNETNRFSVRYFSSAFLGHTTAEDLLDAFLKQLKPAFFKKLLNVSMDGPNVNLKLIKDLEVEMKAKNHPEDPLFLYMGSCGLHVVNGGFKTGAKSAGWGIVNVLRSMYNFFKNVPSRRHDYIVFSKSKNFPLKFCAVRWLHNAAVAERAIAILPNLEKYVEGVRKAKKEKNVTTPSYETIKTALKDNLLTSKLAFFASIANMLEPFLTEFQSDKPMAPFLFCSLEGVLTDLMKIFVKKKVLAENNDLHKVDLSDDKNLITAKDISLSFSFSVKDALMKSKATELEKLQFKNDCRTFLKSLCTKLLEKSPLAYGLCRGISCLDPGLIGSRQRGSTTISVRLRLALSQFVERKWLSSRQCDQITKEFLDLVGTRAIHDECKDFDRRVKRLDDFWMQILSEKRCSQDLKLFVKLCLGLSHGNASLERGFSVNREVEVENQKNDSLVAQRQVYDGVMAAGGIQSVKITKEMISKVRLSRSEYMSSLEERRRESEKTDQERLKNKRLTDQIHELQEKRRKVTADLEKQKSSIDDEIAILCAQKT
ncbi:uncharacterized protein LOC117648128 [Thrips palmi]|uniref:Uncharacterized protein LOC117648128 n=1 Tax=Thrips palmi TaxID=161013 RepID=A0A6P8ZCE2_THRPL|nr:uncharacterized protein LOC117648128 [Thrips palmi]XP_034246268.1 uncharacterized protein LOC117648128 [Thrips palmi]